MVETASAMLPLGTQAPRFELADPTANGKRVSSAQFQGQPLLVAFICNHCPYVKHIQSTFTDVAREYQARGVAVVAISSNDVEAFPEDSPEKMAEEAAHAGYTFPYLYDETQDVARAYHAACTPDFFLFDRDHRLVYRGQFGDSRPKNGLPVTGYDLRAALEGVLDGRPPLHDQKPSVGCNIKWKSPKAVGTAH